LKPDVYRKIKLAAITHEFLMPLLQHVFPWNNQAASLVPRPTWLESLLYKYIINVCSLIHLIHCNINVDRMYIFLKLNLILCKVTTGLQKVKTAEPLSSK